TARASRRKRARARAHRRRTGFSRRCRGCRIRAGSSGRSGATSDGRLEIGFQQFAQRAAELGMLQAERDIGFEIAELFAAIVSPGARTKAVKRLTVGDQLVEAVGQLDLAAGAGLHFTQMPEDLGLT